MRLLDLDPRWFAAFYWDGEERKFGRVGFTMLCPHCQKTRLSVTMRKLKMSDQMNALAAAHPGNGGDIVPAGSFAWAADINGDFATLTVTPSVDASPSGHWHGFITDGEAR